MADWLCEQSVLSRCAGKAKDLSTNSITYQAHLFGESCQFVNLCAVQLCIHNVKVTLPLHSSGVKGETSPVSSIKSRLDANLIHHW